MANKPTQSKNDPATLAFSAVEGALQKSRSAEDDKPEPAPAERRPMSPSERMRRPDDSPAERQRSAEKIATRALGVANDDRTVISSGLLYTMQARPSSAPFWLAVLASVIWAAGVGATAWARYGDIFTDGERFRAFLQTTEFSGFLAVLVLPILGFLALGFLLRRAQDLRLAASSMTQAAMRLSEPETTATQQITTVAQAVRREVNAIGDGLERALSRASEIEVMVHNEINSLERSYSDNESRMRALIDELSGQREAVMTNAERVREAISGAHQSFSAELQNASHTLGDQITSIGNEAALKLTDKGDQVSSALQKIGTMVETTIADRTDAFASTIENRRADLLAALDETTDRFSSAIEDRTNALADALDGRSGQFIDAIDQRSAQLDSTLTARTDEFSTLLDERARVLGEAIDSRTGDLSRVLNEGSTAFSIELEQKSAMLANILRASGESILVDLSLRSDEIAERLSNVGQTLSADIVEKANDANVTLAGVGQRFDEAFAIQSNSLESRVQSALIEMTATLDDHTTKSREIFLSTGTDTMSQLTSRVLEITGEIDTRVEAMDSIVGEKGGRLVATLNQHQSSLIQNANLLENALNEKSGELNRVLTTHTREFADAFVESSQNFQKRVDASLANVTDALDSRTTQVSTLIEKKVAEVNETLGRGIDEAISRITDAEQGVSAMVGDAATSIEASVRTLEATVDTAITRSTETLEHSAASMANQVDEHLGAVEQRLDDSVRRVTQTVDVRLGTLPEAITARVDISAERLASLHETINSTIAASMVDLETGADRIENALTERVAGLATNLATDVENASGRMDIVVRSALDKLGAATRAIEDLVGLRAPATAEDLSRRAEALHKLVAGQAESFTSLIESSTAALSASVAGHTHAFDLLVEQKTSQLDANLKSHGNILRAALELTASEAEEIMSTSTSRIASEVTEALDKLNQGNHLLQQVLSASTGNLAELESSVGKYTKAYAQTVKDAVGDTHEAGRLMNDHVNALGSTISGLVAEMDSLKTALSTQTAGFSQAARDLNEAGTISVESLEAGREAMDTLVSGFAARAGEIDARLRSFAEALSIAVNDAEDRIRATQASMAETVRSSTDALSTNLHEIADTASAETERAGEVLRATQQHLIDELQQTIRDATSRFADTAEAMRATATQVGQELEATRAELQRGVIELPEETRASAAAMRRVVAEQIEALNELNTIVRAQPASYDLTHARRATGSAARPAQRDDHVAPAPRPAPAADGSSSALSALLARPAANLGPQSTATSAAPRPAAAAPAADGWLRDLLRNASAEERPAAAPPTGLSSLTAEIVRAVDDTALTEAWTRFRQGEAGAFSRRLYTLAGQGTFDDVRKKIRRDPEFADATNKYMAEFEQLLQQASKGAGGPAESHKVLISDRGKVYTMLAHAGGRLD